MTRLFSQASVAYRGATIGRAIDFGVGSSGMSYMDDYQVDLTEDAAGVVAEAMFAEVANAGQESLVATALENMEIIFQFWAEFEFAGPHDEGDAYLKDSSNVYLDIKTDHPEAIGLIIAKGEAAFYDFVKDSYGSYDVPAEHL